MIILAIDTTETTAAAAITDGETPLAARAVTGTLTHSETMLPMILELFGETGLTAADVGLFACSAGPGSFTGVRIGVSLIKGLAFGRVTPDGNKTPCSGVSALEALALNLRGFKCGGADGGGFIACPVMDARRGRFYNALFAMSGGAATRICPDRAVTAAELAAELARDFAGQNILLCGGGAKLAADTLTKATLTQATLTETALAGLHGVRLAPEEVIHQSGVSVAVCAYRDYLGARLYVRDDLTLAPVYLRPPQADRKDFG